MTTATAQAATNLAFIKFTLTKLHGTNGKISFGGKFIFDGLKSIHWQFLLMPDRFLYMTYCQCKED